MHILVFGGAGSRLVELMLRLFWSIAQKGVGIARLQLKNGLGQLKNGLGKYELSMDNVCSYLGKSPRLCYIIYIKPALTMAVLPYHSYSGCCVSMARPIRTLLLNYFYRG